MSKDGEQTPSEDEDALDLSEIGLTEEEYDETLDILAEMRRDREARQVRGSAPKPPN